MIDFERMKAGTDMIHGAIKLSGLEDAVVSTPIFNRLHRVLQSSMVYLTFPSNKVKRFEHSVGTMHLAGGILYNSIVNTEDSALVNRLLKEADKELAKWSNNGVNLINNNLLDSAVRAKAEKGKPIRIAPPDNALYRDYYPIGIDEEYRFAYTVLFEGTRIAGLLHDVGHLPYSHVFEFAAGSLYAKVGEIRGERRKVQERFLDVMKPYYGEKEHDALHEAISSKLLTQIVAELAEELPDKASNENLFTAAVFYFVEEILSADRSKNSFFSDIHRIISGVVDADRLDYCSRDLFGCGIRKDVIHYDRLLSSYRLVEEKDEKKSGRKRITFTPGMRMIHEVEDLLDRRWEIFSDVNYHHKVHKHEILFSEVLSRIGFQELQDEDLEGIPILDLTKAIPLKLYSIWSVVEELRANSDRIDYPVIQIDDGWMDTLLKNAFFEKYGAKYRSIAELGNDPEWNMFDELISASKHYLPLYKRSVDFREFDARFTKSLSTTLKKHKRSGLLNDLGEFVLKKITSIIKNKSMPPAFTFHIVMDLIFSSEAGKNNFYKTVEAGLNKYLDGAGQGETNAVHCLLRDCCPSLGCYDDAAPAWFHQNGRLVGLEQASIKVHQLKQIRSWSLPFHLYYLPCYDDKSRRREEVNITMLEEKLCSLMTEAIASYLINEKRGRTGKGSADARK